MQSDWKKKVETYLKAHKQKKRTYLVLTVLSALMAFTVYGALSMPAISMTKDQPRMEAKVVRAIYGDELSVQVTAEAEKGDNPTVFVLHTESSGAGLSDVYLFDEDDEDAVCLVDTDDGKMIELHRDYKGKGIVNYWFTLEPEETASFLLYCNSDRYPYLEDANDRKASHSNAVTASRSDAMEASSSDASKASSSDAETNKQFFRIYSGAGKNYKAGLRAAKSKDNSLEFVWSEKIEELILTAATEDGVVVTMSGPANMFPAGDLQLTVKEVSQEQEQKATPSDARKAMSEEEAAAMSEWLFDISIMNGDEEVEPFGPVEVTFEGIIDAADNATATIYHIDVDNDTVDEMEAWTDEDGKVKMQTDHFSLYKVLVAASSEQISLEELLGQFGIANQFAVFANRLNNAGHDIEGSIAVKELGLGNAKLTLGNTPAVGQQYGGSSQVELTIHKVVAGYGAPGDANYRFDIYGAENDNYLQTVSIEGEGTANVTLDPGNYRVYEVDEAGKRLEQGAGENFSVSYDALNLGGFLGGGAAAYVNNGSFIESFITNGEITMRSGSSLHIGEDNTVASSQNDRAAVTSGSYTVNFEGMDIKNAPIQQPTDINWEDEFERLSSLSERLSRYKSDYAIENQNSGVYFLNLKVPTNGVVDMGTIRTALNDQNLQSIPLGKGQFLTVNLDCSQVPANTPVHLDKIGVNGDPGGWNPDGCRVIWNLVKGGSCYTGTTNMSNGMAGIILSPEGTVDQTCTFNGSIIADTVTKGSDEIHQHSFRVSSIAATTVTNTYAGTLEKSLEITKTSEEGTALPGTKFELYRANEAWQKVGEEPLLSGETDSLGVLRLDNLQLGNYLLYETQPADGYIAPEAPWKIVVKETGAEFPELGSDVKVTEPQKPGIASYHIINQRRAGSVTVSAEKRWEGGTEQEHPASVTVHLLANGQRIKEPIVLNSGNQWIGEWKELPQTEADGTSITYSVEEETVEGYYPSIISDVNVQEGGWVKADNLASGGTYMLVNSGKALASAGTGTSNLTSVDVAGNIEDNSQAAKTAQWTAQKSGDGFVLASLENANRKLGLYTSSNKYYLYAGTSTAKSNIFQYDISSKKLFTNYRGDSYYLQTMPKNSGAAVTTYKSSGLSFDLYEWNNITNTTWSFTITNTKEAHIPNKQTLEIQKTIDALRPQTGENNPDTGLDDGNSDMTDFYRLYLDLNAGIIGAPADVVLVLDNSNSMQTNDMNGTRANTVVNTAESFAEQLLGSDERNRISIVGYSGTWKSYGEETGSDSGYDNGSKDAWSVSKWSGDYDTLKVKDLEPLREDILKKKGLSNNSGSGTNIMQALKEAGDLLKQSEEEKPDAHRYMIFISDGYPTYYYLTSSTGGVKKSYYSGYDYYYQLPADSNKYFYFNTKNYSCANTFQEGYWGRFGTGQSKSGAYAKQPTIDYANQFHTTHDDTVVYALGVGTTEDKNSPLMTDTLKKIATAEENYFFATNAEALYDAFYSIMYGRPVSGVTIADELSQYVEWYQEQPDVLVTMTDKTGKTVKLWQGTGSEAGGNVGRALPGNIMEDGETIIQNVTFIPNLQSSETTTGTVKVTFDPNYTLKPENIYTLSFNVKTTQAAYDEYAKNMRNAENGYADSSGDPETDYGTNDTSSGHPGFHSNFQADAGYVIDGLHYTQEYDHPVIQVADCGMVLRKTDAANPSVRLEGAEFDLYRETQEDQAGSELIPGTDAAFGTKVNQNSLPTNAEGEIIVEHLVPAVYYLVETKAPTGYQLLEKAVRFELKTGFLDVEGNGMELNMVQSIKPDEGNQLPVLNIKNITGFELPHTGGLGTRPYTAAGLLIMATALFYAKKRSFKKKRG